MKKLWKKIKRNRKQGIIAVVAIVVLAVAVPTVILSGNGDKSDARQIEGSTVLQTNEAGETLVVATNSKGETVVYETDKSGKVKESKKSSTKAAKATSKTNATTAAPTAAPTTQATQAQNVCYVSVEGYCSGKAISLQGGDTAYSVLTRTGVSVSAENTTYGLYVKGINGRFASGSSGWLYSVNGVQPNRGAGGYGVGSGDRVSWYWGSAY